MTWERVCSGYGMLLETLERLLERPHMPQAWLILGPRGVGKRTLCEGIAARLSQGLALTASLESSSNAMYARSFVLPRKASLQALHAFKQQMMRTSLSGGWKIGTLLDVHELGPHCIHALLKLIENPPVNTLFLLTSSAPVMATLRSRCFPITMAPLTSTQLNHICPDLPEDPLFLSWCGGCIGRAYGLLESRSFLQQTWDLLMQARFGPPVLPKAWLEVASRSLDLFEEILVLWFCHQSKQAISVYPRVLRLEYLQKDLFSLLRQSQVYHLDFDFLFANLYHSIASFFSEDESCMPALSM
jgi:hypothetical protein